MKFLEELNTWTKAAGDINSPQELKAVASSLANIFNANKEMARAFLGGLPGGQQILGTEAGREMAKGISRSGAAIGDLINQAIQTAVPPKVIGEIAAYAGISQRAVAPLLERLK